MDKRTKPVAIALVIVCLACAVFVISAIRTINRTQEHSELISKSYQLRYSTEGIMASALQMEAGLRGYILAKDPDVLEHFQASKDSLHMYMELCKKQMKQDSVMFKSLSSIVSERTELIYQLMEIAGNGTMDSASVASLIVVGDDVMDDLRIELDKINQQGSERQTERIAALQKGIGNAQTVVIIFGCVTFLIAIGAYYSIRRETRQRRKTEKDAHRSSQKLKEIQERYENLYDSSLDAICIMDKNGTIIQWNAAATKLFGYSEKEVAGKQIDLIIPDRLDELNLGYDKFSPTDKIEQGKATLEVGARDKKGRSFPVQLLRGHWKTGNDEYFSASMHDISVRKEQEARLNELLEELERSNEDLQQFAYVASHDLQEPLRKIRAFGDRLKDVDFNDPENNAELYIERMQDGAMRMQILIQDLLAFSRVSRGEGELESVDLNILLNTVLSDIELSVEQNNAEIVADELPIIENGNRNHLQRLLQNLLTNAIKFRKPDTPPKVIISHQIIRGDKLDPVFGQFEADQQFHVISVKDNGIGFDQKYVEKIFTIFQRLHGRSTYKGTGIGLAVCRKICENHKGFIWAFGKPDEGSEFVFGLPAN